MRTVHRYRSTLSVVLLAGIAACNDPHAQQEPTQKAGAATGWGSVKAATATATQTAKVAATTSTTASASASNQPVASTSVTPTTTESATTPTGTAPTSTGEPVATAPTVDPTATVPEPVVTAEPPLTTPEAGSAEEVASNIDAIFKDTTRFKARFTQKHKQKISGKERESQGTVYVLRPNRISFHYDEPNKNRIVSDGTTLKLYVAEDSQMFEHPVKDTEYPGAFGFIMGTGIRRSFSFAYNEKTKSELGPVLIGTPKTANPQYEQVYFYVDKAKLDKKDPGAVKGVLILDAQGNRNRFELFDQTFPETIDPNEFKFTPPEGTNITK